VQFLNRVLEEGATNATVRRFIPAILSTLSAPPDERFRETSSTPPSISNPHLLFRPTLGLLDPDALEVARQLTLIYHEKYRSIHSLEFMISISERRTTIRTPTLAEFFTFGDFVTKLFAEAFVRASNREEAYTKICEIVKCLAQVPSPSTGSVPQCSNWDAISCIVWFLKRDDILRLARKGDSCPPELQQLWVASGEEFSISGNRTQYDDIIKKHAEAWTPTIPNMRVELKSGDKGSGKQPDIIDGLVNWAKLQPLAAKCKVLNVFQRKRYSFVAIPQIQKIILKGAEWSPVQIEDRIDELVKLLPKY
jgi:hypothetical protein